MTGALMNIPETVADAAEDGVRVFVCAGPPKCAGMDDPCPWCYVVESGDERTTDQIMKDMHIRQHQ